MPVGYIPDKPSINNSSGKLAVQLRNLCRSITDFHSAIGAMGPDDDQRANALVAMGFTTDDAAQMVYLVNVLNTVAALYYGTAVQPQPFDFDNALSALWGTAF